MKSNPAVPGGSLTSKAARFYSRPALEAEAVARMRTGRQGTPATVADPGRNSAQGGRVNERIAQMAGVSKDTVKDYHAVQVQGSPALSE